jgi:membrane fusion protein (multidrug efflux system)
MLITRYKRYSLLLFLIFFSCIEQERKIDPKLNMKLYSSLNVRVKKTINLPFLQQIIVNGKIVSINKVELRFKANDKIKFIIIKNGQKVNKGQLLASLENSLLKNKVENVNLELQKTELKLVEEKINFDKGKITPKIFKNLEIKSGVLEAKNNLERAKLQYKQTLLKAPFSGLIANLEKKNGDFITSSEVFCQLINPNNLEVSFSVLENEFSFVSKGQNLEIHSFANTDKKFKGVITEINPIVDKNGLIKIKAKITTKNAGLLDGMRVKVFINKPLKNVIVIPKEALVLRSNREVVFTLEKGFSKWNDVEIVGENNDSYAIKKGLKIIDTIIVSGNLNLSHDAKVNATFVTGVTVQK